MNYRIGLRQDFIPQYGIADVAPGDKAFVLTRELVRFTEAEAKQIVQRVKAGSFQYGSPLRPVELSDVRVYRGSAQIEPAELLD